MAIDPLSDAKIVDSWHKNAAPWTNAVRGGQIASRKLCTDRAVVDAVLGCSPGSLIDVGCGEGWLCRALAERGVDVLGVDAVPELIDAARAGGGGEFRVMSYEAIIAGELDARADAVVCNFSLIGKESVEGLIGAAASLLNPGGKLVVQTLHPRTACGDGPYEDGWRQGSWAGFDGAFTDPAPWYFRTMQGWERLLADSGLRLAEVREPRIPGDGVTRGGEPVSVVFIASAAE
ncbi:MAG: class I SAM-dependent methyltransferase [Planctomycetota bacterium]